MDWISSKFKTFVAQSTFKKEKKRKQATYKMGKMFVHNLTGP